MFPSLLTFTLLTFAPAPKKNWCSTNKSSPANKARVLGYALWPNESYQFSCSMSTTNSKINFAFLPIFPILPTSLQDVNNKFTKFYFFLLLHFSRFLLFYLIPPQASRVKLPKFPNSPIFLGFFALIFSPTLMPENLSNP